MTKKIKLMITLWLMIYGGISVNAAQTLRLADVLTDNMVLQRGKDMTCWGWAKAGSQVEILLTQSRKDVVAFAGKAALVRPEPKSKPQVRVAYREDAPAVFTAVSKKVTADKNGKWVTTLGKHAASFTPTFLAVRSGEERVAIQNLLIGEVWIASGQSNMEWAWSRDKMWENQGLVFNGIRYAKVRGDSHVPRDSFVDDSVQKKGRAFEPWIVCEDGAVNKVATVPYLFAQYLHRRLKVPVGIINIAMGGSYSREWCSRELLEKMDSATVNNQLLAYDQKIEQDEAMKFGRGPASLYNARLHPLRHMTVAGVIYMQGENESLTGDLPQYGKTFPGVIQSYRDALTSPELPFGIITLQGYGSYSVARDIHLETHKKIPNTGYIVAHDIGGGIHPSWKRPLSERAVYWALRDVYTVLDGVKQNRIKGVRFDGKFAMVDFVESQLKAGKWTDPKESSPKTNDQQRVAGFEIAGKDRVWYRARIKTDSAKSKGLFLSHPLVSQPVAVRYGWGGFPCGNLGSWEDPIPPFRSDDWPIVAKDAVVTAGTDKLSPAEIGYLEGHARKNRALENGLKLAIVDSYEQLSKRYAHPKGMLLKTVGNMQELMQGFDAKKCKDLAPDLQQQALHSIPCRYWRRDRYSPPRRAKWGWLIERVIRFESMPQEMNQALKQQKVAAKVAQLQKALSELQVELTKLPDAKEMTMDTMLDKVLPMMEQEKVRLQKEEGMDPKKLGRVLNKDPF